MFLQKLGSSTQTLAAQTSVSLQLHRKVTSVMLLWHVPLEISSSKRRNLGTRFPFNVILCIQTKKWWRLSYCVTTGDFVWYPASYPPRSTVFFPPHCDWQLTSSVSCGKWFITPRQRFTVDNGLQKVKTDQKWWDGKINRLLSLSQLWNVSFLGEETFLLHINCYFYWKSDCVTQSGYIQLIVLGQDLSTGAAKTNRWQLCRRCVCLWWRGSYSI